MKIKVRKTFYVDVRKINGYFDDTVNNVDFKKRFCYFNDIQTDTLAYMFIIVLYKFFIYHDYFKINFTIYILLYTTYTLRNLTVTIHYTRTQKRAQAGYYNNIFYRTLVVGGPHTARFAMHIAHSRATCVFFTFDNLSITHTHTYTSMCVYYNMRFSHRFTASPPQVEHPDIGRPRN